jgi:hypothetical protein
MLPASGRLAKRENSSREDSGQPSRQKPRRWLFGFLLLVAAAGLIIGIYWGIYWPRPRAKSSPKAFVMGWRPVISWSGQGSTQTEAFNIQTGQWRIKWSTKVLAQANQAHAGQTQALQTQATQLASTQARGAQSDTHLAAKQVSPANNFRLVVHSLVSGRFVTMAADHQGAGSGVAYLAEEPRQFFLVIESSGLNWTVQVEEGVEGEAEKSP